MKPASQKEIKRLLKDPFGFALLMDAAELESVIVAFVEALNTKKTNRGDQNRNPNLKPHCN